MYHRSIQWFLDQWFGKSSDKSGHRKDREHDAHAHAKREGKKKEEQSWRQSEGRTENPKNKDERYFASILGLQTGSTSDDIRNRYRELVMQYHPDRVAHLGPKLKEVAEQQMKEINEAYNFFKRKYRFS